MKFKGVNETGKNENESLPSPSEMTELIKNQYQESLRHQVPELILLAQKVETVHKDHPSCPVGLSELLHQCWLDLQDHLKKEEKVLFPIIQAGNFEQAYLPIRVLKYEHAQHRESLKKIQSLRQQKPLPNNACRTWMRLFHGLEIFEKNLMEQIQLEDEILFPHVLSCSSS